VFNTIDEVVNKKPTMSDAVENVTNKIVEKYERTL